MKLLEDRLLAGFAQANCFDADPKPVTDRRSGARLVNLHGRWIFLMALVGVGLAAGMSGQASWYADEVISYRAGTLPANLKAFTNAAAALGLPSLETPGPWGGPVDPFSPPYLNSQLVSIGQGGEITVRFDTPIEDQPDHPFGLDLLLFGNAGFLITNGNFTGGGVTDGNLLGNAPPESATVWVSADNTRYYALQSVLAPQIDSYYPTDGAGFFGYPVNPGLKGSDFSGLDLGGIRALYAGSAGGTGFDLAWAVDEQGRPANLKMAQYLRLEVLAGHVDIDGFTRVTSIPEPASWILLLLGSPAFALLRRSAGVAGAPPFIGRKGK